jgi:hypothetical protein
VEACKIAGMLLKQIFVENGETIKFHIDSSIANINARAALSARIMVGYGFVMYVMTSPFNKSLPALWGRPERICPDSTCHPCGPEHRDISTPSEELSGRSREIR